MWWQKTLIRKVIGNSREAKMVYAFNLILFIFCFKFSWIYALPWLFLSRFLIMPKGGELCDLHVSGGVNFNCLHIVRGSKICEYLCHIFYYLIIIVLTLSLSKSLQEMFVIIKKGENVNICLDRNTLVLMIDKRSPRKATMQKAEKRIQAFKSWILFFLFIRTICK
jgi:hypothetical protein